MKYIEITLLILAYTLVIVTIFLELVCYKKNLEKIETIAFTFALLLLIISMTISPLLSNSIANVFKLASMVFVGLTTPLSIMVERKHNIPASYKKILFIVSAILLLAISIGFFVNALAYIEYIIIAFLVISVMLSMLLIRNTKPKQFIAHREQTERMFAIAFLVVLPISILANFQFVESDYELNFGFTLPLVLVFIFLSGSKIFDNIQRLSLFAPRIKNKEQRFNDYSISKREKEVALLLIQGKTYKQVAEELHISVPTVKTHSSTIYKKCGVKNRTELAALLIG